jgi:transcriptional regulator with XRE-family HTH domain
VLDGPDFGDRLRVCRVAASLSQEELSALSGVSVRAIGNLERGRTRWPHPGSVHRLADALQLTDPARAEFVGAASRRLPDAGVPGSGSDGQVLPRQLPSAVSAFAGRSSELAALSRALARPGGTAVITAIGGTAGVGKTALALQWGHLVAAEFPDGQLYVNLNGFGPSSAPVSAGSAVRVLLEGLGVPAERLPHSDEGQLNLYRSLLAGRRMLIVLDNARDEAQVRPLLPGALTCRVVVTSRNLLAGLTALEAAHPLLLDVLTEAEAWDLLERRLGPERLRADDGATYQLIKASAYLPLAMSIVAARAALRPGLPVAEIAAELTADRGLDAFSAGEPAADIRAVLSWSYRQLDDDTARTFRLAGLHPGPDLDRYGAAALTGMTLDQAGQALLMLSEVGLMLSAGPGRYSMHDLLREYARELSTAAANQNDAPRWH